MRLHRFAFTISVVLGLISCSKDPAEKSIHANSAAATAPSEQGGTPQPGAPQPGAPAPGVTPSNIQLSAIASEVSKSFLSDPALAWHLTESQLILNRADGTNLVYDRTRAAWEPIEIYASSASYASIFAYPDRSFVGINASTVNVRIGSAKVLSYDTQQSLTESTKILGVSPGFFAAELPDGIMILKGDGSTATAYKIKGSPPGLIDISLCVSGCVLWGYDGKNLHTYDQKNVWTSHTIPFSAPEGKSLKRLALNLKLDANGLLLIEHAAVITGDGELWVSPREKASEVAISFEQVKALTTRNCVLCHSTEFFDQERGLKAMKTKIIARLTLDATNPMAMPPKLSEKAMSGSEKAMVVAWLQKQTEGVDVPLDQPSKPTNPTPTDPKTIPVTGVIATQSTKHCLSCHPNAKFQDFWISKKTDISSRVTSGDMPRGKILSDADKAALLMAVDQLK